MKFRKVVLLTTTMSCLAVLATTAFVFRISIEEQWHLARLESADADVRAWAARRLWDLGSPSAAPYRLKAVVEERLRSGIEDGDLAVVLGAERFALPERFSGELEVVCTEASSLEFLAFDADGDRIDLERIVWPGPKDAGARAFMERAVLNGREGRLFRETIRSLPGVVVQRRVWGGGMCERSLNHTYLVQVRLLDDADEVFFSDRSIAYYWESGDHYVRLRAVVRIATELMHRSRRSREVEPANWRESRFSEALARDCNEWPGDIAYGFLLAPSIDALAFFGSPRALEVLRSLKDSFERVASGDRDPTNRRLFWFYVGADSPTIDAILERPEHWLAGPPKDLRAPEE